MSKIKTIVSIVSLMLITGCATQPPQVDAFAIADITQFNYADVNALSVVGAVDIDNYANMGALDGALVSSVATAVGNNASISVSSPVVESP